MFFGRGRTIRYAATTHDVAAHAEMLNVARLDSSK
jgi:hypothetical protein